MVIECHSDLGGIDSPCAVFNLITAPASIFILWRIIMPRRFLPGYRFTNRMDAGLTRVCDRYGMFFFVKVSDFVGVIIEQVKLIFVLCDP